MLSELFNTVQGIEKEMEPWLFNVFMNKYIRNACVDIRCMFVTNVKVCVPFYEDYVILMAENSNALQCIFT